MTLPRILSAVGRTLAVLGVVMLLFAVFQLWGTGLQQARAQSGLKSDLAERFRLAAEAGQADPDSAPDPPEGSDPPGGAADPPEGIEPPGGAADPEAAAEGDAPPDPRAEPATAGDETAADTAATDTAAGPPAALPELPSLPYVVGRISETASARAVARLLHPDVEEMLPLAYPDPGEAIARIIIPSIDVDEIVVAGVEVDDLRKGPGHYSTTPLPGQPGNAAIAGHRTTYGAPFGRIAELNTGDAIIVETLQGRFVYRVLPGQAGMAGAALGFRIVAPTALEVLNDMGDNRLTLTSCHPKYSSQKRIVVHAALVGDPVVRLPRPGEPVGAEHVQLADGEAVLDDAGVAESHRDGDTAAAAPGTEPPSAPPEPEARPAGEPEPAIAGETPGETPGDSGSAAGTRQAAAPAPQPPAAPVAEVGFGEGHSGDRGAVLPAVLWGMAAAAVWGLGWAFGRSGRRALRYTVAAVAFLAVLYAMFSYVDRALPAY